MRSCLFFLSVLLGVSSIQIAHAQSEQPTDIPAELQPVSQLIAAGQYPQAFAQIQPLLDDWSGEPIFDYLYGLAALNSGELDQARFAFERILIAQPNHHRARLELARLQMAQGQWVHANENFSFVLSHEPPEAVRQNIERMRAELSRRAADQQPQQQFQLSLSGGHDANINSATSLRSIDLNFAGLGTLTATLPDAAREQATGFSRLQADGIWLIPQTQHRQWFASVQAEHKQLLEDLPLDQTQLALAAGVRQQVGLDQFQVLLQSQSILRDGDRLLWSPALSAQWQRRVGRHTRIGLNSRWSGISYAEQPQLNLDFYQLAPQLNWQQGIHQWLLQPTVAMNRLRQRKRDHLDHDQWGVSTRYQIQALPDWSLSAYAQWQQSEYAKQHPTFGQKRQDDYWHVGAEARYQWRPDWQFWSEVRHTVQDSNLPLYEYDRTSLELGVRYLWQ
ncbi:MAG: tetratricopeptide repeat protein [Moraxellaceae bacterium]